MMAMAHYRADRKHQVRSLVKTWHLPKAAYPPPDRKRIAAHDAGEAMEGVYLSIPYRIDSGESDQKDEFEGAITKSCSTDPQFPNQAAKNGT